MEKKQGKKRIEMREASEAYSWETGMDRRTFLQTLQAGSLMALMGGTPLLWPNVAEAASYEEMDRIRRRIPKEGEPVPEIELLYVPDQFFWHPDMVRKWALDGKKIGLKYKMKLASTSEWLDSILQHTHGDIQLHPCTMRPERVDPSEWLVSRAHSSEAKPTRRNYGEYECKEYDHWVDLQLQEFDLQKRLQYVQNAQKVLADDYYICVYGWGPAIINAYNAEDWEGIVQTTGFGIADIGVPHSFLNISSKIGKKRLVQGQPALVRFINIIGETGGFRSIGRLIYDRYVYLDKDLNIIPWAAEGWKQINPKTFDIKLRGGMKFHDGKPVTADDVKFTFDYVLKYKPGMLSSWVKILEKVEIQDRENRIIRFYTKEPYGQFLTYLMLVSFILPKHLWENVVEEQKVGNPDKVLVKHPIGSGPFKFVHYKKDVEMLLVANKEHFRAPKIDELLIRAIPSTDGLLAGLENREIDTSDFDLLPSQAKRLEKFKHLKLVRTKDIMWQHAVTFIARMPWRDIEFRKAWHHTIDKRFVADVLWEGAGEPAVMNTFLNPNNPWHNPNLPKPPYDLKLAHETLMKAGYTIKGERLIYPPPTDKAFLKRIEQVVADGHTWIGKPLIKG